MKKIRTGIIYCYHNPKTGKRYVGQTIHPNQRKSGHKSKALIEGSDYYFHRSLRKYGMENFEYIVLEDDVPHDQLNDRENHWMVHYNTIWPNGYNQCFANSLDETAINKMSATKKAQWKALPEEVKLERLERLQKSRLGCTQTDFQKKAVRNANQMKWVITHPDGKKENITNLRKWCIDNGLGTNGQSNLTRGKYKGYCAYKYTEEQGDENVNV